MYRTARSAAGDRIMDYRWFLFGFKGRINRAKYWLALFFALGTMFIVLFPIATLVGGPGKTSFQLGGLISISGLPSGSLLSWVTTVPLSIFIGWMGLATSVKRLHDRNMSAWWLVPFVAGPMLLDRLAEIIARQHLSFGFQLLAIALNLWFFIATFCLRGTRGPNRFGPDPLPKTRRGTIFA
jgi:uncharacterized membrane protein YhaH (DUF805 family)